MLGTHHIQDEFNIYFPRLFEDNEFDEDETLINLLKQMHDFTKFKMIDRYRILEYEFSKQFLTDELLLKKGLNKVLEILKITKV